MGSAYIRVVVPWQSDSHFMVLLSPKVPAVQFLAVTQVPAAISPNKATGNLEQLVLVTHRRLFWGSFTSFALVQVV